MPENVGSSKDQALSRALQQIEKAFGKGSIMHLDGDKSATVDGLPTGSFSLDLALGGRGLPRGRVVELFGPESSGKTTLALHVIGEAQKLGGTAAFIDAEHALDPSWAKRLGVNLEALLVSQPDTGEQALEICEMLVRSNAVDVVVVDSVAALIPRAEIEGEMGDSHMGLQARLMSQALRKLAGAVSKSRTIVIFINQIREKIGVMFGNPETTPGGRALKFYASIRIDVRRITSIKEREQVIGNHVRAKVVKNKVAPPFREGEFDILFDSGISTEGDLLDLAVNNGVIDKAGAWFSFGEMRLGQGREGARYFLRDNPDVVEKVKNAVLHKMGYAWLLGEDEVKEGEAKEGGKKEPANKGGEAVAASHSDGKASVGKGRGRGKGKQDDGE
jgi:recombination protein RecA